MTLSTELLDNCIFILLSAILKLLSNNYHYALACCVHQSGYDRYHDN